MLKAVELAAFGAGCVACRVEMKAVTVCADPAALPGGVAQEEAIGGRRMREHGAGADKSIFPDSVTADDSGVGADSRSPADQGVPEFVFPGNGAAGVDDVGEHRGGADKDLVFAGDAGVDRDVILYPDAVAQDDTFADHDILTNVAVVADGSVGHDMGKMPDLRAAADGCARVDDCRRVGKILHKRAKISQLPQYKRNFCSIFALIF